MKRPVIAVMLALLVAALPLFAQAPGGPSSQPLRAVFHFVEGARDVNARGLQNVIHATRALGDTPAEFVLVVHGPALRWFRREEPDHLGTPLASVLATRRAEWRACRVTLEQNHWNAASLLPGATIVPSGTLEILRLQQLGYAYFRP